MSSLPIPRTRRYEVVKFIYTADDGSKYIRTQRIDKDINGDRIIELPACFEQVTKRTKDKIWGDPENLRKCLIIYPEPENETGEAQITIYVPERPINDTLQCVNEIVVIANQFSDSNNVANCVEYRGETRFTLARTNQIT